VRLSTATMPHLSAGVVRSAYDRGEQKCGIVHFGIGAFHRAHQAVYTDDAMNAGDRHWAITGVSLRSPVVAAQMNPQDGLYTVTERSDAGQETRLVGAVGRVLVAQHDSAALTAVIAAPDTHIVSFTITEKGYCRRADGSLDDALIEGSVYDYLARGMQQRMAAGLPGLTLLCCDNLGGNGAQLSRLMSEYLERRALPCALGSSASVAAPRRWSTVSFRRQRMPIVRPSKAPSVCATRPPSWPSLSVNG
jgi:fructuronate reductase